MRVLETKVVTTYSMGKKNKHKLRKSKENDASESSEEISGRGCQHVNKAVNFNAMKKGLAKQVYGECVGCAKDSLKRPEKLVLDNLEGATSLDFIEETEPTLWVCLQCGHQGCGRATQEKHALKHYETPRSSQHNVVINTTAWSVWCYECDDELQPEKYKKVSECLEHIKKIACVPVLDSGQGKNSSGGSGPSGGETGSNKNRSHSSGQKVLGLSNLGNTCFFNAVLQNLIQTYSLENLLRERKKGQSMKLKGFSYMDNESCSSSDEGDNEKNAQNLPTIEISVSDPGPLTQALVVFLQDTSSTSKSSIINPSALFGQVCKKAPRFKGMQQQDSHELLRYLLDNMKTEEIKRGQTGILKHFKLSENANPKKVDEDTKTKVKVYGREIKHTFVECLFGGQLISTVVCEECRYISQILEPFLDLSLPVTEEKPQRPNQGHGARKRDSTSELKDDLADSQPPKEDKISKHINKKMKKQRKRDARRKNTKSSLKSSSSIDKEGEGEDKEDEEGEEKEEEEEEEGEEGKHGEQEERDASDADVEDNLESDTSRYYGKTLSDSVFTNSTIDESLTVDTSTHNNSVETDPTVPPSDCTQTNFIIETAIDNCVSSEQCVQDKSISKPNTSLPNGCINCSVSSNVENDNGVSVSYTIQNGCITETNFTVTSNPVSNGTVDDKPLCNGIDTSSVNDENCIDTPIKQQESKLCNGPVVQETTQSKQTLAGAETSCHNTSLDDRLTEVTKKVSELSVTDKGINSVSTSDQPINGDISVTYDVNNSAISDSAKQTAEGNAIDRKSLPDVSKLDINADNSVKFRDNTAKVPSEEVITAVNVESKTGVNRVLDVKSADTIDAGTVHIKSSGSTGCTGTNTGRWKELKWEGQKKSVSTLADRYHPNSGECSVESCLHQFTAAELLTGNNKFGCKNCTKLKYKNNPNKEKKENVYSNANKQYLIFQPPAVLTLHLKRFEQVGFSSRKVNRHVDFPFVLDIAPYCSSLTQGIKPGQKKILYSLYGVVEHSGRLTSGHYTAYVKVRPNIGTFNNFLNVHNVTLKEYLHRYAQNVINGDTQEIDASDFINTDSLIPPGRWYHISDSRVNEVTEASVEKAQAYLLFYERIY